MIPQLTASAFDVATIPTTTIRIVLLPAAAGGDPTLFGETVRARNARVAARIGATLIDGAATELPAADGAALLVPPHVAINTWLFPLSLSQPVIAQPAMSPALDGVLDVSTPAARRNAARRIVGRTGKATDGWVSRHCNRPLSRFVTVGMLSVGLTPAHASLLTLLVGLAAAALGTLPGAAPFALLGVLFHVASVLDGVDGEMARATLTESESGARLDTYVDQATYVACFVGVMIGWIREDGAFQVLVWAAVVAAGLVFTLFRGARFVARYAPDASFVFIDRSVRRAARDTRKLPLRVAAAAFTLLRRDVFAVVFMLVGFLGNRAAVPVLVAGGVVVANLTFSIYTREMAAAAVAERG